VAVTVHFEQQGEPMCLLFDIVKLAKSHSGINLARAFANILKDYGISHKVSIQAQIIQFYTHFFKDAQPDMR
jgi:HD superfamily phosphodiesterase